MQRIDRIYAALASWRERPFVYGESDCCRFVNHVYARVDKREYLIREYQNRAEADALVAEFGSLSGAVNSAVDRCHVDAEWLREGDLALHRDGAREGLGIVVSNENIVTVRRPDGRITLIPLVNVVHGWRMDADL